MSTDLDPDNPPIILPSTPTRPLSPPLRAAILAHLLSPPPPPPTTTSTPQNKPNNKAPDSFKTTLLSTLSTHTGREEWQSRVHTRCIEILSSASPADDPPTYKELRDIIVAESLANFNPQPNQEKVGDRNEGAGRGEEGAMDGIEEGGEGEGEKTDVRISDKAMKAGAKVIVREMQERGGWVVEGVDDQPGIRDGGNGRGEREWRDWR